MHYPHWPRSPLNRRTTLSLGVASLVSLLGSCVPPQESRLIRIDGSSTVYPISKTSAERFKAATSDPTQIAVNFSGTGGGFKKFCAGEIDITGASRPILAKEMAACDQAQIRYTELPVAYDALTIVVHPQNTWVKELSVAELKTIWGAAAQGKIKTWKQVNPAYPDQPLRLFGPGKDSGTYDYFNSVILGEGQASRTDYVASEDDETIAQGVELDPNALGYFGLAYFREHQGQLRAVPINNGKGAIAPTEENVKKALYQPLARPLFLYVNARVKQENPSLRKFIMFYLKNAISIAPEVGYVALPPEGYYLAEQVFQKGKVGTVFAGVPDPTLTIRDLLKRQAIYEAQAN